MFDSAAVSCGFAFLRSSCCCFTFLRSGFGGGCFSGWCLSKRRMSIPMLTDHELYTFEENRSFATLFEISRCSNGVSTLAPPRGKSTSSVERFTFSVAPSESFFLLPIGKVNWEKGKKEKKARHFFPNLSTWKKKSSGFGGRSYKIVRKKERKLRYGFFITDGIDILISTNSNIVTVFLSSCFVDSKLFKGSRDTLSIKSIDTI